MVQRWGNNPNNNNEPVKENNPDKTNNPDIILDNFEVQHLHKTVLWAIE